MTITPPAQITPCQGHASPIRKMGQVEIRSVRHACSNCVRFEALPILGQPPQVAPEFDDICPEQILRVSKPVIATGPEPYRGRQAVKKK